MEPLNFPYFVKNPEVETSTSRSHSDESFIDTTNVHGRDCFNKDEKSNKGDFEKRKKRKKNSQLTICLANCKYDSVFQAATKFGFREVSENEDWNLFWSDSCIPLSRMMEMEKYQKVNHFPGMLEICRKDLLARNLNRILKLFPKDYNFFPKTFYLPADYLEFQMFSRQRRKVVFILKPENNCQGKGIRLVRNYKSVPPEEHVLCQQYISKPFLIDGLKFDFRIYVFVTSCDPFRIYIYKEGLARFATVPYMPPSKSNMGNIFMHLTNYSINKRNKDFCRNEQVGNKRKMSTVLDLLVANHQNVDKMIQEIDDIIIKSLISIHPVLKRNHNSLFLKHEVISACFEILGFDILLDKDLRPHLLEVNHSPSFATDSMMDKEVKEALLFDALRLINFHETDKKKCLDQQRRSITQRLVDKKTSKFNTIQKLKKEDLEKRRNEYNLEQAKYELANIGQFRLIYPKETAKKQYYEKFYNSQPLVYQETKASRNRAESARLLRENLSQKHDQKLPIAESPQRVTPVPTPMNIHIHDNSSLPVSIIPEEEKKRVNELTRRHARLRMYGVISAVQNLFTYMEEANNVTKDNVILSNTTAVP